MCLSDVTETLIINFTLPGPASTPDGLSFELPNSILRGDLHLWRIAKLFTTATTLSESALIQITGLVPDTYIYDATTLATGVIPYKQGVATHIVPQNLEMFDGPKPWYKEGTSSQQANMRIQVGDFASGIFTPGVIASGNGNYTLELEFASSIPRKPKLITPAYLNNGFGFGGYQPPDAKRSIGPSPAVGF